jgi:hypothetical protein
VLIAALAVHALGCSAEGDAPDGDPAGETVPELTWQQLRNATYPSQVAPGSTVTPVDGELYGPAADGSAPVARLADIAAFGDLDVGGSGDTAVFLLEATGPETWATSVVAVLNNDGQPAPQAPVLLGTNAFVRSAEIAGRQLAVRFRSVEAGSANADVFSEVSHTYALQGEMLQLTAEAVNDVPASPPLSFRYVPTVLESSTGPATETLTLDPRESAPFVINAAQGQQLELSVSAPNDGAVLSVQGLSDESQPVDRSAYATSFSGSIPVTQAYSVNVSSVAGASIDATLKYNLTPADTPAGQPPLPVAPPATVGDLALAVPRSSQTSIASPGQPLGALSGEAAAYFPTRDPANGVAVVTARDGLLYSENGDEQMETASVIKVVVMACVMARAEQQGRYVDEWELSLMWPMITYSDNDATDALWGDLGGGPGVAACLDALGASGITPYQGPYWGTSTASATGMATLMARLAFGEIVSPAHRAVALALLVSVVPEQRWGVAAGADESGEEIVGIKDGWYPDEDGWRVNSVGFIAPLAAGPEPYAIAVMTNYQSTQEYGIETIEGLALPVYQALRE